MSNIIPFELHITIGKLMPEQQGNFLDFCFTKEAKPLMIELAKGNFVDQPMFSKIIYAETMETVMENANDLAKDFGLKGFVVKRMKIEVPLKYAPNFYDYGTSFSKYFEWHGKIEFRQHEKLAEICKKNKAHLSLNAIKNNRDNRFITLREFGSQNKFENRVGCLIADLANSGFQLLKQESEYCIYDNNSFLDNGWLPQ